MAIYKLLASTVALTLAIPSTLANADDVDDDEPVTCPEFVRDSKLALTDTAGGSQVTITTPHAEYVPVLRMALREAARFVERRATEMSLELTANEEPSIPLVSIGARDIKAGVTLTVKARKAADVPLLRRQTKMIELLWKQSSCINPANRLPPGTVSA